MGTGSFKDYMRTFGFNVTEEAEEAAELKTIVPDLLGMTLNEGKNALFQAGLSARLETEGETITGQMPPAGESVNKGTKVLLRME